MESGYEINNFAGTMNKFPIDNNSEDKDSSSSTSLVINPSKFTSSLPKIPGRMKNTFTLILEQFTTDFLLKKPKKEFFNVYIIRAIKRTFRSISNGRIPLRTCISINLTNNIEMNIWNRLEKLYRLNPNLISHKMKTVVWPLAGKRKTGDEGYKSFNNAFCKEFFSEEIMRKAFNQIIELFYCNFSPARCCSRFNFYCCSGTHIEECEDKWLRLKNYFSTNYFKDLDIQTNQDYQMNKFEGLSPDLNFDSFF
ncbi:hypothetical protein SteCoe_26911 [Stentor coeruleus]|uniref:Uncharacterized protein n=1 Tax=Stentor coeruleus TaxID=5963 RepID=A0A1R2BBQ4_9CILI|nr:hypothetical protein SteCoe_26911 [Stentor coeruleus]